MGIEKRGGGKDLQPARLLLPPILGLLEAAVPGDFLVRLSSNEERVLCTEE